MTLDDGDGLPITLQEIRDATGGADTAAIHDNQAGEISAVSQEGSALEDGDAIIGEDAQNSYAKIKILLSEIATYIQTKLGITAFGLSLTDDDNATEALSTLGAQAADADLADLADGSLTGSKVGDGVDDDYVSFDDADNLWTATKAGPALEEMNDSINAGAPNGTGAKVHWSQLLGVPAGFADGADAEGAGSFTGGTLTSELVIDETGIEGQPTDTLTDCSTFSATGGGIFYDDSEGQWKKCEDGVLSDLDTAAASGLASTDIDTSGELRTLVTDESGTGALIFAGGAIGAATATTPATDDNDTSVATTAYVQGELIGGSWASPSAAIGSGTPVAITATTLSAGAAGFAVDADGDTTAKSLTLAASAAPGFDLRDSDNPGTDKWSASFEAAYVDGADGAENSDVLIYANQGGAKTLIAQFDESDDQWETTKNISAPSATVGALTGVDSIDATGAVDMDYGSADVTDHTFVSDGGTVIIDGNISIGADPADAGAIRLPNAGYIYSEADAAGTDISVIGVDSNEVVQIAASGAASVTITPDTTFTGDITVGGAGLTMGVGGVLITTDNDGAVTILGQGNGSDEDININLDDTSNTAVISSSTGVTLLDFGTIGTATTGIVTGGAQTPVIDDPDNFSTNFTGRNLYGGTFIANAAGTAALLDPAVGMNFTYVLEVANANIIDPLTTGTADTIVMNGLAAAQDENITSSTSGAMCVFQYRAANSWMATCTGWAEATPP
ncbi:MAG TPA: hypothetical protein DCZ95_03720 [Verrucomicrobia bacterium]|nr:hypothetical protein [Verrucomicrobiota bacterium]